MLFDDNVFTKIANYIHHRAEELRVNNRASEQLLKTLTVLNELFYGFAKAFDRFARGVYLRALKEKVRSILERIAPRRTIGKILESLVEDYKRLEKEEISKEILNILNAKPILPSGDRGG